ncbi:MAG: 3-hexulose-6-phosphate synthase [Blautia sp.]|uniref:3-hexulose-6-phosphate synthase n=1 Tax=Blautia ammoniilytica TaxID=2981782 RepID=A0ABT2TWU6_9FIRM|nr:3-hexulose-6-phosphate synthase [Blautia ammoniilytica]MCU6766708.1 orotidine 5'-phosphate decarboxylase [Blautia ammoniilytica]SCI76712.1 3-hexulose-6-phosphate synthase [uncultured Blautia sp.]
MVKLQAAIDYTNIEEAFALMEKIEPYIDIIEIGTMLGLCEGFSALGKMKQKYPHKKVLCDAKLVDGGYDIASYAYDAGADIVTTIGMTNNETCSGVVRAAHERGKEAMVDMIGVANLAERVQELDAMGFDYILVHTAHDMLNCISAPLEALKVIKANVKNAKAGISGGITVDQMPDIVAGKPDWVVVGSALYTAKDPLLVAKSMKEYMK